MDNDYDSADDSRKSYDAAIAAKRREFLASRATLYDVLNYAADQFTSGRRQWRKAGAPHKDEANCLMLAIIEASRELDAIGLGYDAVIHVQRYIGAELGPWNDAPGRTLQEIIDVLKGAALLS